MGQIIAAVVAIVIQGTLIIGHRISDEFSKVDQEEKRVEIVVESKDEKITTPSELIEQKPRKLSHNADKILGSLQRIFDMADQGGFSQKENLARLNLWVTNVMMSGIQGSAAMISGITLKVPQIDIDRVAKFLVEKDPAQLVKLREHPKFDAGVLEQAVLRAFVLDDYLRRMDTFYGNSTNLPPSGH